MDPRASRLKDPLPAALHTVNGGKWRRIGIDRKAGVLVPLWSLRTRRNSGIGEVLDLELLVDWCVKTRQNIIQLLPANDTGYDAPPYCSCSAFAMNPTYLSLHDIPGIDLEEVRKVREAFEPADRIVYYKIRGEKMRLLWEAYVKVKDHLARDESYTRFCRDSAYWMDVYSAFMVLKDKHEQRSWRTWEDAPVGTPELVRDTVRRYADEAGFYRFLQWHLDRQWRRVRRYANDRGVLIKGDIPYLLNNDAADVWALPEYFRLDLVAGCPPDFYNAEGQYWSFPTYRWDALERDQNRWWIERLRHAERYFDIFRIDHVLGFFRIWSIPAGESAVYGQFVPSVLVTPDVLRHHGISGDEERDLIARKILLSAGRRDSYAFKWKFIQDESFRGLSEDLQGRLRGMENYFSENEEIQSDLWRDHGKKWLSLLSQNTKMLICAEDLGTVPACVRPTLLELGITRLLVDRWTKFVPTKRELAEGVQESWIEPGQYDPVSVSSPSNHDMPTLRGWWIELGQTEEGRRDREEQTRRFGWTLGVPDWLDADAVRSILQRNLNGRSVFTIFFIQEILDTNPSWQNPDPAADRVNLPGVFSESNWSWRMRVCLEDLCAADDFNRGYAAMVRQSGRGFGGRRSRSDARGAEESSGKFRGRSGRGGSRRSARSRRGRPT